MMIETTKYRAGKTLCVLLVTDDDPPFPISINLYRHPDTDVGELAEGEFVLNHSYLHLLPELIQSGLAEDTGRRCSYGYATDVPILRLAEQSGPPRMRTGREVAIAKGLLPEKPPKGLSVPASAFEAAGLPMVVACSGCGMTMSLIGPSCRVDATDRCWCAECAGEDAF